MSIKHRVDDRYVNTSLDVIAAWETLTRLLAAIPFVDIPRKSHQWSSNCGANPNHSHGNQAAARTRRNVPASQRVRWGKYRVGYQGVRQEGRLDGAPVLGRRDEKVDSG